MNEVTQLAQKYILLMKGVGNFCQCVDWALKQLEEGHDSSDIVMLASATSQEEALPYVESILRDNFEIPSVNEEVLTNSCGVTPQECTFYFEVVAPHGLLGVERPLADSGLELFVYHSHFNNKNILKSGSNVIDLGMDTSTTDVMHGSGFLYCDFKTSLSLMKKLSLVFKSAGYSHKIGVDDEEGNNTVWITGDS